MLFDVQRFSTHDGSGIRTIVFFKGCPLRCPWCCNPESQSFGYDVFFDSRKCIVCNECVKVSENMEFVNVDGRILINRQNIMNPSAYKNTCPANAIRVIGEEIDTQSLLEEIDKDMPFFENSGGGVTFSGGEPFSQPDLLLELAEKIKGKGISLAVESCLDVPWDNIKDAIRFIDELLIDVKHVDSDKLQAVCGVDFIRIEQNLRRLEEADIPVVIRIPIVPGFNDDQDSIKRLADFAHSFKNINQIHLLPYHTYGKAKYGMLGLDYGYADITPDKETMERLFEQTEGYAAGMGLKVILGG